MAGFSPTAFFFFSIAGLSPTAFGALGFKETFLASKSFFYSNLAVALDSLFLAAGLVLSDFSFFYPNFASKSKLSSANS